jgi:7,8-dihydropterin-6-yl-methyl-4-(beta-D-ribofuranosyl)aminobenzene 5'-phosphate synthase
VQTVKLRILYDNIALEGFRSGYGFSCLIEEPRTLFDTGGDVLTLLHNMDKFGVDPGDVDRVVLSHEHGDHTGGVEILKHCGEVEVYLLSSSSDRLKRRVASYPNAHLKQVSGSQRVYEGIFTTGELGRSVKEQSLMAETGEGLVLVTGCAHPGLDNILQVASKFGGIYGVVGGFHGFSELERLRRMRLIVACHCTRHKREILNRYPGSSVKCSAGCTIEI